ncbi:MAG: NAD(P)H:quinone oxidoreductase [Kangiellaceae bacterium]|nr:NAD(P)H:quinone oxidoreductase [Kangiellaceae bacterium]
MSYLLVLYYSSGGRTRDLAHLIAKGIESEGVEALIRAVPKVSANNESTESVVPDEGDCYATIEELENSLGLAVGSPTRFGNMAAPLKYFIDQTSNCWMNGKLASKPVSFFTSSSSLHGGQESTLLSMMIPFLHHGMLVVGLPYSEVELLRTQSGGTPYGVSHWDGEGNNNQISQSEQSLALAQGKRLAVLAQKLNRE